MSSPHEHFTLEGASRLLNIDPEGIVELIEKNILSGRRESHGAWTVTADSVLEYLRRALGD